MNIVDKLFSDEYINKNAAKNNVIIYLLGRLSYPFAVVFAKIGITPNQITTLSTLLAILSAAVLIYDAGWELFVLFWSLSLLFDFCDGTVARMTDQVRKTSFRYDHTSDLFKIFIVILGAAIKYDDNVLWITSMSSIFFFMFFTLLNHEYSFIHRINGQIVGMDNDIIMHADNVSLKKKIKNYLTSSYFGSILVNIYTIIFSINGHSLLIFLLFYCGKLTVIYIMCYLMILSSKGVYQNINNLRLISKL
jgi:hypothetical protein